LWRNRTFTVFWAGQTVSALGDAFAFIATPLVVLEATGSVLQMGLATGAFGVGQFLCGLLAGPIIDRFDRRRLMIYCDLGRAVVQGTIPVTWWLIGPSAGVIYGVSGITGFLGNAYQVAGMGVVANLVDRGQLTEANGRLMGSWAVMFVIGPVVAGIVSGTWSPVVAIGVNAASFVVSAVAISRIRLRERCVLPSSDEGRPQQGAGSAWIAGFRFLRSESMLGSTCVLLASLTLLQTGVVDLLIFHVKRNLEADDRTVGTMFALASLGAIVGAGVAPGLRRRWGFGAGFIGASILQGAALMVLAAAPTLAGLAAVAIVFSAAKTIRDVYIASLRTELTPDHLMGRVTAAFWTITTAPGPLGAALVTAVAGRVGVPSMLFAVGLGTTMCALIGAFTPVRKGR
jgi:MFS family permease